MVADTAVDMKEHMVADMEVNKVADMAADKKKHCQRHNGPRILSPKDELSQKAETNANSNLAL